jgi:adenylate kinase family enzyme
MTLNKVCIVGCGGSGKSTFAQKLGEITGLPVYYLDTYFWRPGWVERNRDEWKNIISNLTQNDGWIMDGNFNGTQDFRFAKADTIIFLDLPRYRCMFNAVKRVFSYRKKKRIDMADGCYERFDFDFYKWIWGYKKKHGLEVKKRLNRLHVEKTIVVLKNYKEIDSYLEKIKEETGIIQIP